MSNMPSYPFQFLGFTCVVAVMYEVGAFLYRGDRFKSVFRFVKNYPGYSLAIVTGIFCLGVTYAKTLKTFIPELFLSLTQFRRQIE